jgi:hypothetical protein
MEPTKHVAPPATATKIRRVLGITAEEMADARRLLRLTAREGETEQRLGRLRQGLRTPATIEARPKTTAATTSVRSRASKASGKSKPAAKTGAPKPTMRALPKKAASRAAATGKTIGHATKRLAGKPGARRTATARSRAPRS